ncbi:MAG: hypothetical protein P4L33_07805 [Capsulimonadaceae bacterium]|nr:hypothetical protein [Capsulimonadaceae bacterium]
MFTIRLDSSILRLAACVASLLALASQSRADLLDGVTAYLPFDGSAAPRYAITANGINAAGATYDAGIAGQGVVTTKEHFVAIPLAGNFVRKCGSISFWIKPSWDPADASAGTFRSLLGTDNFALNYQPSKHCLFFMTGKTKPVTGYDWDYRAADNHVMARWNAGEWHHIALTWDAPSGSKTIYLDGKQVSSNTTDLIRDDAVTGNEKLFAGGPDAAGVYDELIIWNRVLSAEEVAQLASRPAETAHELMDGLPTIKTVEEWPIAIGLAKAKPYQDLIVEPGHPFDASIPAVNRSASPWQGTITFTLLDVHESVRATYAVSENMPAGGAQNIPVSFKAPERGIFKIRANVTQNGKTWIRDVASFAAWPQPGAPPLVSSFFGNHVNAWSHEMLAEASRLGLGWQRDHNMLQTTWFSRVEPDKGNWAWKNDFQLEALKADHMPVLGQLFGTPYWAPATGALPKPVGDTYPYGAPPELDAFREYVARTVNRYKDSIRVWEIWNEPEVSMFWNGSPEQLASMIKTACLAAKEADPTCTVLQCAYTSDAWKWHELAARAGAFQYADGISMHYYYDAADTPEKNYDHLSMTVKHFRELANRYGRGSGTPIWNTECGIGSTTWLLGLDVPNVPPSGARPPQNAWKAAVRQVQFDAQQQSLGIVRSFAYLQNIDSGSPYFNTSTLEVTGSPKPALMARVALASQVDGARCAGLVRRPEGRLWAMVYEKPHNNGCVVLWWVADGAKVTVQSPLVRVASKFVDFMGNDHASPSALSVCDEPSYLHVNAPAQRVISLLLSARITVVESPTGNQAPSSTQSTTTLPDYPAPKEDPAGCFTIDLRPYVNMGFYDAVAGDGTGGWADEGPLNCLSTMPTGRRIFYGVPFDIIDPDNNGGKSIITLRGKSATPSFPSEMPGISLGNKTVRALYFLQAAVWGSRGVAGSYVVHYTDKQSITIPIDLGVNSGDWWSGYQAGEQSKPIAIPVTNTADGKPATRYPRVWEWQNPRRDIPIAAIDFLSAGTNTTPILIAISGAR